MKYKKIQLKKLSTGWYLLAKIFMFKDENLKNTKSRTDFCPHFAENFQKIEKNSVHAGKKKDAILKFCFLLLYLSLKMKNLPS